MGARLNQAGLSRLRDTLQSHIDAGRIPGAVALMGTGGEARYTVALGAQDPAGGQRMAEDSIFRVYSMTKPIVSLACLMLAERGLLSLADPVGKYLPEFAGARVAHRKEVDLDTVPAVREPTLQDLLRHTAGLTYEFLGRDKVQCQYEAVDITDRRRTNAEFSRTLASVPLAYQPGSCWMYSRATDVLGAVLEVASGKPLGRLLGELLLDPLGMKDTAFATPQADWGRLAEPFAQDPESGARVIMMDARVQPAFESGGGGLMSTAPDYLRFMKLLRNCGTIEGQRLVSRKTIEWMTADHLGGIPALGDLLPPGHGFGLGVAVRLQDGVAAQPGSAGTYFWSGIGGTFFFIDPREDMFAMLLTQAPGQRIFFRNLFRHLAYAAID